MTVTLNILKDTLKTTAKAYELIHITLVELEQAIYELETDEKEEV